MTSATDLLVLPTDVRLTLARHFPASSLDGLDVTDDDWIATRVGSRSRSIVISTDLAELVEGFRTPSSVVHVTVQYARAHRMRPEDVLERSWPMLMRLIKAKWLVPKDSYLSSELAPWYEPGSLLGQYAVEGCVHVTDDTQVYRALDPDGRRCALKVVPADDGQGVVALDREGRILEHLDGSPSPCFIALTDHGPHHILAMEWCEGVEVTHALNGGGPFHWAQVRDLLVAVTDVYASLHRRSVVHGDVHPGNVLVESDGRIRLLDFGLARLLDEPPGGTRRGGAPEYFDPAYARAVVDRASPPPATAESEQYALGALCYRLATGQHYLRFEPEATRFYRQVLESPPLSFADQGVDVWPEVESVLVRALAKREDERHESVERMAEALAEVDVDEPRRRSAPRPPTALPSADKLIARVQKMTDPEGELFATGPPAGPRATVMNGAAGIAYYLLRVAELTGAPLALAAADAWAERARVWADQPRGVVDDSVGLSIAVIGTASPYHTGSGIELVRALVGHARGDSWTLRQATRRYIDLVQQLPEAADPTLGATSVLTGYSHLVRCLHQVPDQQQSTEPLLDEVIRHGDAIANQVTRQTVRRPLDDESSTLAYTGAAHGWAGVLYTLMTWWEVTHQAVDHAVATRLEELAARAVGRHGGLAWPMRTKAGTPSFMNSWCHGSPGHVYLWNLAHRSLGTSQYGNIAESAAVAVREEAGPNLTLCCGQAGHVFALLNQYRHSRDGRWLRAAEARVQGAVLRAADAIEGDWSHSLYKGDVGLALAALEVAYPEEARHPVFE